MNARAVLGVAVLVLGQATPTMNSPWLGTWKLNAAKSVSTTRTRTITRLPNGYRFDSGAIVFDLPDGGKDAPSLPLRTANLKALGDGTWTSVQKLRGKDEVRDVIKVSDDGSTLTTTSTGTRLHGHGYQKTKVEHRVGTGSGLAGTWQSDPASGEGEPTMVYTYAGSGRIQVNEVETHGSMIVSFDGRPVPMTGPRGDYKEVSTWTAISDREWKFSATIMGKPAFDGKEVLSDDGKTITETFWFPGKPDEIGTLIYEKQ